MSDADLTQYNRTAVAAEAANAADALTSQFLVITDNKLITGELNGANQAPVNRALKRLGDMIAGVRGALLGNVAGVAKRTLKGIYVDLIGGAAHTKAPGTITASGPAVPGTAIEAESGDIKASNGDLIAVGDVTASGDITGANIFWGSITGVAAGGQALIDSLVSVGLAGAERLLHGATRLTWAMTSTGASGSNPPQGTSVKNQLRAKNTPKCSAFVRMSAPGVISSFDGYGIQSVSINGGDSRLIDIVFTDAFDNANYTLRTSGAATALVAYYIAEIVASRSSTATQVVAINTATGLQIDFAAVAASFSIGFDGQQTT